MKHFVRPLLRALKPGHAVALLTLWVTLWMLAGTAALAQEGGRWERGQIVGLRAGTCIREGPGLAYRAHTKVPDDDWAVMIIDGPRTADGHIWWDTSRKAAGDPSGGTGWVTEDQSDTDCPWPTPPVKLPSPPDKPSIPDPLRWWYGLPTWAQWLLAAVVLLVGMRVLGRLVGWAMELLGALLLGSVIWLVMAYTREYWGPWWAAFAPQIFPRGAPDLALLLAALPAVGWLLSLLRRLAQ